MYMNFGPDHRGGPRIEELNGFAERLNEEKARGLREDVIKLVHEAASVFLREDVDSRRFFEDTNPDSPVVPQYINQDFMASPGLVIPEYVDAISYQLVRSKQRAPGQTFGADRITMYVPVDKDFDLGSSDVELPDVAEIDEVYVRFEKQVDDELRVTRYAVTRQGVFEYITAVDSGEEVKKDEIFQQGMHYVQTDTQVSYMNMLAQLLEDHRNFQVVHQTPPYISSTQASLTE